MMRMICTGLLVGFFFFTISINSVFADVMDRRQDNIGVQEIYGSYGNGPFVPGTINKSPNFVDEHCVGSEVFGDWALEFDISCLRDSFANFDVNNIYIDGRDQDGEKLLNVMQQVSLQKDGTQRLMSLQHGHWSGNKVSFCVGATARGAMTVIPGDTEYLLENKIYLWYNDHDNRILHNVSSSDICTANGNNWLQKFLEGFLSGISNSAFCADQNNKADIKFNTQNNTATLTSKVPLKSNGAKTLTISFSQAGVSSAQVKIF